MSVYLEISWPPAWIRLAAHLEKFLTVHKAARHREGPVPYANSPGFVGRPPGAVRVRSVREPPP
ncbi:hypothetical protein ACFSTC_21190 [Nonomuraea ferruginea]